MYLSMKKYYVVLVCLLNCVPHDIGLGSRWIFLQPGLLKAWSVLNAIIFPWWHNGCQIEPSVSANHAKTFYGNARWSQWARKVKTTNFLVKFDFSKKFLAFPIRPAWLQSVSSRSTVSAGETRFGLCLQILWPSNKDLNFIFKDYNYTSKWAFFKVQSNWKKGIKQVILTKFCDTNIFWLQYFADGGSICQSATLVSDDCGTRCNI